MNQKNPDNILIWIMVNQYLVMNLNLKKKFFFGQDQTNGCVGVVSQAYH